jgi:aryl-alcohol dehydrogenase-like predicted oxidoreductase
VAAAEKRCAVIETVAFAGTRISRLIKGGWQLHERAGSLDRTAALADMHAFADAGISTFEAADIYDGVEALIGAFNDERRTRGLADVRVHTRLSVPRAGEISAESIARAVDSARAQLHATRLDLVQLSMWQFNRERWLAAARHIARTPVDRIGVQNVDAGEVAALRDAGIAIASAQAQFSLLDRRAERTLLPACRAAGLAFFGYGALTGGLLSGRWLGQPDPGMTGALHPPYRVIVEAFGGWALLQRLLTTLDRVAQRHGVGLGTVALRWVLDHPGVTSVLIGASNAAHLPELLRLSSLTLDPQDHAEIDEVLAASTGPRGPVGALEREPDGAMARAIAASLGKGGGV